jgi:hypothetical protein
MNPVICALVGLVIILSATFFLWLVGYIFERIFKLSPHSYEPNGERFAFGCVLTGLLSVLVGLSYFIGCETIKALTNH